MHNQYAFESNCRLWVELELVSKVVRGAWSLFVGVPKKTKDLIVLVSDTSERTARDWLKDLKTAESLIMNTIRESADSHIQHRS